MGKTYINSIVTTGGFQFNANMPLDDRLVVDTFEDLAALTPYEGIIVYIKNNEKYYSYVNDAWDVFPASADLTYDPDSANAQSGKAVAKAIAGMVDSAPETLNTLNELAAALGDDPNFATTVATQIGNLEAKVGDESVSEQITSAISNNIDTTLTQSGKTADAKSVGDQLSVLSQNIEDIKTNGTGAGQVSDEGGTTFGDTDTNKAGEYAAAFGSGTSALGAGSIAGGVRQDRSGAPEVDDPAFQESDWRYNEALGSGSMAMGMGAVAFSRASKSLGYRTQTGRPVDEESMGVRTEAGLHGFSKENVGQAAVAIGSDTVALENNSFAGGHKSVAGGKNSFAFGSGGVEASGSNAVAMGEKTKALGTSSFALGRNSEAEGKCAVAIGVENTASNINSLALGTNAISSGQYATAIGHNVKSQGPSTVTIGLETITSSVTEGQVVLGKYNTPLTDATFIIGNGWGVDPDERYNTLVIDKDNRVKVDAISVDVISNEDIMLNAANNSDVSIFAGNTISLDAGNISLDAGNITLRRAASEDNGDAILIDNDIQLFGDNLQIGRNTTSFGTSSVATGVNSLAAGASSKALGNYSAAIGRNTTANGECSLAVGSGTTVDGVRGMAMGHNSSSAGNYSFAGGVNSVAGVYNEEKNSRTQASFAFGHTCQANANFSIAAGYKNSANGAGTVSLGYENHTTGATGQMVVGKFNAYENGEIDKALFVVGNGSSSGRKNALVVNTDGSLNIAGKATIGGDLKVTGKIDGDLGVSGQLNVNGNTHIQGNLTTDASIETTESINTRTLYATDICLTPGAADEGYFLTVHDLLFCCDDVIVDGTLQTGRIQASNIEAIGDIYVHYDPNKPGKGKVATQEYVDALIARVVALENKINSLTSAEEASF